MRLVIISFLLVLFGCIDYQTQPSSYIADDQYTEGKRIQSFEKVMKSLPNIVDIRDQVDLIVSSEIELSKIASVNLKIYEMPGGKVLYKGSLPGIMSLPRNRIKIPISHLDNQVFGVFSYKKYPPIKKELQISNRNEIIIDGARFQHSVFYK